ncbi:MAG: ABC transporter substrate-binding protein [Acidimicrobiia bacterium]
MGRARIVSLVPSVTETLCALGVEPLACTRFCEQPSITAVGGTKDPDVRAIVALAPDAVVMNDEENRREDYDALRDAGLSVIDVSPRALRDVGPVVGRLAALVARPVPAPFHAWEQWCATHAEPRVGRSAVVFVWRRPWMALGPETFGASLLGALGIGVAPLGSAGALRYPEVTLDEVERIGPDMVLLPSEPYPFAERHRIELERALPAAEVRLVDGQDLFWWGSRTPDALMRLRAELR